MKYTRKQAFFDFLQNHTIWYFKQIIPLQFKTTFGEDNKHYFSTWRMFLGRCFNVNTVEISEEERELRRLGTYHSGPE